MQRLVHLKLIPEVSYAVHSSQVTGDINTPTPKTVSLSQLNWKNGKVKFEATKLFIVLGKFEATIAVLGWVA